VDGLCQPCLAAVAAIPPPQRCVGCGWRWRQDGGLCRSCARAGGDTARTADRDAESLARQRARQARPAAGAVPALAVRVIDGVEYVVVYDGRYWWRQEDDGSWVPQRDGSSLTPADAGGSSSSSSIPARSTW
jgi:hypothetical protein